MLTRADTSRCRHVPTSVILIIWTFLFANWDVLTCVSTWKGADTWEGADTSRCRHVPTSVILIIWTFLFANWDVLACVSTWKSESNLSKITRPVAAIKSLRFALLSANRILQVCSYWCWSWNVILMSITKLQNDKWHIHLFSFLICLNLLCGIMGSIVSPGINVSSVKATLGDIIYNYQFGKAHCMLIWWTFMCMMS